MTTLSFIQVLLMYCGTQGAGANIELARYALFAGERDRSASCMMKMWNCTHIDQVPALETSKLDSCISKHIKGELK